MASKSRPPSEYEVGYGKPPKEHQIKPGERRNPNGRPRKARAAKANDKLDLEQIVVEEMGRLVPQSDGTQIELARRIVQDVALKAAKGSLQAARLSLAELRRAQQRERDEQTDLLKVAVEYKFSRSEQFAYYRRMGWEPPDVLPHPAHVIIENGEVRFAGPIDPDDRAWWERLKHIIKIFTADLATARQHVREFPGEEWAEESLKSAERFRRQVMRLVPKGWNWREEIWTRDSETPEKREAARLMREYEEKRKQGDQDQA